MASVTVSLTEVGVSDLLVTGEQTERITYDIAGTFTGSWVLEKAAQPSMAAWLTVAGPFTGAASGTFTARPNDVFRVQCRAIEGEEAEITGTLSDGDAILLELKDRDGNVVATFTQAGLDLLGSLTLAGGVVASGAVQGALRMTGSAPAAADSTGVIGNLRFEDGFLYVCVDTNTWQRVVIETWGE